MSTPVSSPTVLVLGNGPVGQTTALLLARWGLGVVLLDARPAREAVGSRAICQQRDVLDIWEAVGAGRRIAAEGVTWTTVRTFHRDRELFAYTLPQSDGAFFPPFVNISQARTEAILDERIAADRRIAVRWNHRAVGLSQEGDGVVVTCESPAGRVDVTGAYAVACAGGRADDLRGMLGVGFDGRTFDHPFLICDIEADLPGWADERRFYFDPTWNPGRQVLIHPCPGSAFRIDWQVPGGYDLAAEEASGALEARIRAIVGDRPYRLLWKSVYRFQSRVADRMRSGRVLLAGDCAHLFAPFGARGLNSGVADAENAAWKLAFVLHGWAPESLLESYHHERHAAALENLAVTAATMDFLLPRDERQRRRREDILARAAHDPAARAEVDSGRLAEPFWYVDSPLTTAAHSRPFAGRPDRGALPAPGPGILAPDVPIALRGSRCERLHEVARDGFLLLAMPGVDAAAIEDAVDAVSGPVRLLHLTDIDATGAVSSALHARSGELWILRPDAHVAAVLSRPGPADVAHALRRAHGADRWGRPTRDSV